MKSYYQVSKVAMKIEHREDELFKFIDEEMGYYKVPGELETDCAIYFDPVESLPVAEKAIRTMVLQKEYMFFHEDRVYLQAKDSAYVIMVDARGEIRVSYKQADLDMKKMLRWLIKWLIIKTAERKGLVFIHASAVRFKGRTVLLSGNSNCGKSTSLMRLLREGATPISDDSVLTDGEVVFPFVMKASVDADLSKRFGIEEGFYDIGRHVDTKATYGKADVILNLRIWNSGKSSIKPVEKGNALLNLMHIYKNETPMVFSAFERKMRQDPRLLMDRYHSFLENTKCFDFFQGREDEEVRQTLLGFLESC